MTIFVLKIMTQILYYLNVDKNTDIISDVIGQSIDSADQIPHKFFNSSDQVRKLLVILSFVFKSSLLIYFL
jgi:hypothetical protein